MAGALSSLALFAALAIVTPESRFEVDTGARELVALTRGPGLDASMQAVTLLGQAAGLVPLIVGTSLLLWRRERRCALLLPVVMAGTGVLQFAAKWAVDRPRPNLAPWGYPSGHVLSLLVFLGVLVYLLNSAPIRQRWRRAGTGLAGAILVVVAFSRMYLDVHWLSDLGGGFALGMAYLLFLIWMAEASRGWSLRPAAPVVPADPVAPPVPALANDPASTRRGLTRRGRRVAYT